MPASFFRDNDETLALDLGGCRGAEFQDALAKIKDVPGRRFDGDRKLWLIPAEPTTAERVLHAIQPTTSPDLSEWIKQSRVSDAADLITPLPDDAELALPWSSKLYTYQRAIVERQVKSRKIINASEMGTGKCVMAIAAVEEYLLQSMDGKNQLEGSGPGSRVSTSVPRSTSREKERDDTSKLAETQTTHSTDNRREEKQSMCGLRDSTTASMHGSRPRSRDDAVLDRKVAIDKTSRGKDERTDSEGGISEVRRSVPELSSASTLARKPRLIVCPRSVIGVWKRELKQWVGEEPILITAGLTSAARQRLLKEAAETDAWVITNWEQIRTQKEKIKLKNGGTKTVEKMKEPLFEQIDWLAVVADEIHRAKNRKAAQTRGLWRCRGEIMLGLSGTPILNRPDELWSLLHWLFPKEYTSYWRFYSDYVEYYEGYFGKIVTGVRNADALRFELKDRMVRVTKDQVLDLPEKVRVTVPIELSKKQRKLYDEAEKVLWLEVEKEAKAGDKTAQALASGSKTIYQIPNGAARCVRLRQVANNPQLLEGVDESAKMDACQEIILDSQPKQHVVFTEFVRAAHLLAERLEKHGLRVGIYTGEVGSADRTELEDAFQRGDLDVVVGTIGAMKEGITLTASDTVHFLERHWTPGVNEQCEDRLHRVGQTNHVTIYIYEAQNTIDDGRVRPTNKLKEKIVGSVIQKDEVKERVHV